MTPNKNAILTAEIISISLVFSPRCCVAKADFYIPPLCLLVWVVLTGPYSPLLCPSLNGTVSFLLLSLHLFFEALLSQKLVSELPQLLLQRSDITQVSQHRLLKLLLQRSDLTSLDQ
jgi:hypothetical protein